MAELPGSPGPVDRRVGARIRARRERIGLSAETLAARLGCPAALVLDYEAGRTRAGATTLMMLTRALGVDVGYFLAGLVDGAPPELEGAGPEPDKLMS
jgi:transcriptional regulator with XRE-family HTH domain